MMKRAVVKMIVLVVALFFVFTSWCLALESQSEAQSNVQSGLHYGLRVTISSLAEAGELADALYREAASELRLVNPGTYYKADFASLEWGYGLVRPGGGDPVSVDYGTTLAYVRLCLENGKRPDPLIMIFTAYGLRIVPRYTWKPVVPSRERTTVDSRSAER